MIVVILCIRFVYFLGRAAYCASVNHSRIISVTAPRSPLFTRSRRIFGGFSRISRTFTRLFNGFDDIVAELVALKSDEGLAIGVESRLTEGDPLLVIGDAVCFFIVGTDGDGVGRGDTLVELEGVEGSFTEIVGDAANLFEFIVVHLRLRYDCCHSYQAIVLVIDMAMYPSNFIIRYRI